MIGLQTTAQASHRSKLRYTYQPIPSASGKSGIRCLSVQPHGRFLAIGDASGHLKVVTLPQYTPLPLRGYRESVQTTSFKAASAASPLLSSSSASSSRIGTNLTMNRDTLGHWDAAYDYLEKGISSSERKGKDEEVPRECVRLDKGDGAIIPRCIHGHAIEKIIWHPTDHRVLFTIDTEFTMKEWRILYPKGKTKSGTKAGCDEGTIAQSASNASSCANESVTGNNREEKQNDKKKASSTENTSSNPSSDYVMIDPDEGDNVSNSTGSNSSTNSSSYRLDDNKRVPPTFVRNCSDSNYNDYLVVEHKDLNETKETRHARPASNNDSSSSSSSNGTTSNSSLPTCLVANRNLAISGEVKVWIKRPSPTSLPISPAPSSSSSSSSSQPRPKSDTESQTGVASESSSSHSFSSLIIRLKDYPLLSPCGRRLYLPHAGKKMQRKIVDDTDDNDDEEDDGIGKNRWYRSRQVTDHKKCNSLMVCEYPSMVVLADLRDTSPHPYFSNFTFHPSGKYIAATQYDRTTSQTIIPWVIPLPNIPNSTADHPDNRSEGSKPQFPSYPVLPLTADASAPPALLGNKWMSACLSFIPSPSSLPDSSSSTTSASSTTFSFNPDNPRLIVAASVTSRQYANRDFEVATYDSIQLPMSQRLSVTRVKSETFTVRNSCRGCNGGSEPDLQLHPKGNLILATFKHFNVLANTVTGKYVQKATIRCATSYDNNTTRRERGQPRQDRKTDEETEEEVDLPADQDYSHTAWDPCQNHIYVASTYNSQVGSLPLYDPVASTSPFRGPESLNEGYFG